MEIDSGEQSEIIQENKVNGSENSDLGTSADIDLKEIVENDTKESSEVSKLNDKMSDERLDEEISTPVKQEKEETKEETKEGTKEETKEDGDVEGMTEINGAIDSTQKKRVKFLDEVEAESSVVPDSREDTPMKAEDEDREVFEGPAQKVARQTIFFVDFEEDNKNYKLTDTNIRSFLFGPQALLPASRRFKDLKTIARIGVVDNPYSTVKQEEDKLFQPVSKITEEDEMFDSLKRLPRLGIKHEVVEEVEEDTEKEAATIVIKTEAPTGLYLPNNNKKNCVISGTEVKYFDPSNGIPYSSVETYRFLKTIEQGNIPWYSFTTETNDTGAVEIYLGNREGNRHAKGVPDGFDG
jgi:vacuolar protein sorting-associated protein 72